MDQVEIVLVRAPDDASLPSPEFQAELAAFSAPLHAAGIRFSQRGMAFDAADALGYGLGEYVVPLASAVGSIVGASLAAWFQGRAARKVRLKVGDIEAEAQTIAEVEQLLAKAKALSGEQQKDECS